VSGWVRRSRQFANLLSANIALSDLWVGRSAAQTVADVQERQAGRSELDPIQHVTAEPRPVVRCWQEDTSEEDDQPDAGQ
jgi:hypothetical protein